MKVRVRELEKRHGRRLNRLRREVNDIILKGGSKNEMRKIFESWTWKSEDGTNRKLKPGHTAQMAACKQDSIGSQFRKESFSEEEIRKVQEEIRSIDLLSVPSNLLCPILFYSRHGAILDDPSHEQYQTLTQQLEQVKQCSITHCPEQKSEEAASEACVAELDSKRQAVGRTLRGF